MEIYSVSPEARNCRPQTCSTGGKYVCNTTDVEFRYGCANLTLILNGRSSDSIPITSHFSLNQADGLRPAVQLFWVFVWVGTFLGRLTFDSRSKWCLGVCLLFFFSRCRCVWACFATWMNKILSFGRYRCDIFTYANGKEKWEREKNCNREWSLLGTVKCGRLLITLLRRKQMGGSFNREWIRFRVSFVSVCAHCLQCAYV